MMTCSAVMSKLFLYLAVLHSYKTKSHIVLFTLVSRSFWLLNASDNQVRELGIISSLSLFLSIELLHGLL